MAEKDKIKKQATDKVPNQEHWEPNMNRLHMTPKLKGFDEGTGKRQKSAGKNG